MKRHQTGAKGNPRIYRRSHGWVERRAPEVEAAIRKAFKGADFIGGNTVRDVIDQSLLTEYPNTEHLIAIDRGKVVGALFHVPFKRKHRVRSTDLGWIFTSPSLPRDVRRDLGDRLMERMQNSLRRLGYRRIVSMIGTKGGERFLSGAHGHRILRESTDGLLWVKEL